VVCEKGRFKFLQAGNLPVVWGGLPALLLHQSQGSMSRHPSIDKYSAGQQNTASHPVFTVDQYSPSLFYPFIYPGGSLHQLLNRERIGIWE